MAVTILNTRTISVGPFRVIRQRITTGGASETFRVPIFGSSTTNNRASALCRTPLTDGSSDATIRVTAVANEQLTCTIDGGANGDQFSFSAWS